MIGSTRLWRCTILLWAGLSHTSFGVSPPTSGYEEALPSTAGHDELVVQTIERLDDDVMEAVVSRDSDSPVQLAKAPHETFSTQCSTHFNWNEPFAKPPYPKLKLLATDSGLSGQRANYSVDIAAAGLINQSRNEWTSDDKKEIAIWINDGKGHVNSTDVDTHSIRTLIANGITEQYHVYLSRLMHADGKIHIQTDDPILVRNFTTADEALCDNIFTEACDYKPWAKEDFMKLMEKARVLFIRGGSNENEQRHFNPYAIMRSLKRYPEVMDCATKGRCVLITRSAGSMVIGDNVDITAFPPTISAVDGDGPEKTMNLIEGRSGLGLLGKTLTAVRPHWGPDGNDDRSRILIKDYRKRHPKDYMNCILCTRHGPGPKDWTRGDAVMFVNGTLFWLSMGAEDPKVSDSATGLVQHPIRFADSTGGWMTWLMLIVTIICAIGACVQYRNSQNAMPQALNGGVRNIQNVASDVAAKQKAMGRWSVEMRTEQSAAPAPRPVLIDDPPEQADEATSEEAKP